MSNKTIRKVGLRVREVLAALDAVGPCSSWHAGKLTPHIAPANVDKYLTRAVGLQLATVDRSGTPKVFAVVPGWQVLVDMRGHFDYQAGKVRALREPEPVTPLVREPVASPVDNWPRPVAPVLPALADLHPLYSVWAKPLLFIR